PDPLRAAPAAHCRSSLASRDRIQPARTARAVAFLYADTNARWLGYRDASLASSNRVVVPNSAQMIAPGWTPVKAAIGGDSSSWRIPASRTVVRRSPRRRHGLRGVGAQPSAPA